MPVSGARRGSSAAARCRVEERALIAAGVSGPLVVRDADLRRPLTAAALAVVPGEAHVVHPAVEVPRALGADLRAVSLADARCVGARVTVAEAVDRLVLPDPRDDDAEGIAVGIGHAAHRHGHVLVVRRPELGRIHPGVAAIWRGVALPLPARAAVAARRAVRRERHRAPSGPRVARGHVAGVRRRAGHGIPGARARLARVAPRAAAAIVAAHAVGLRPVRAHPRSGVARAGVMALVECRALHGVRPGAHARLTGVRSRAGVAVVACRTIRARPVRRAIVGDTIAALRRITLASGGPADIRPLRIDGARRARPRAELGHVANARRVPTRRARREERVRRAGIVRAVAALGDVARARRGPAHVGLLHVHRARGVRAGAGLGNVADATGRAALGSRRLQTIRRARIVRPVTALADVARPGRRAAHVGLLRVGRARGGRAGARLGDVAGAGGGAALGSRRLEGVARARVVRPVAALGDVTRAAGGATDRARGLEAVRWAGVVRAIAPLLGVARAGGRAADVGLLRVGRAGGGRAGAEIRRVAHADRRATHGGGGLEGIGGARVVDTVAALLDVTRTGNHAADACPLRVGRACSARAGAELGPVAGTGRRAACGRRRLEGVGRAVVVRPVAALGRVARAGRRTADAGLLLVAGAGRHRPAADLGHVARARGRTALGARSLEAVYGTRVVRAVAGLGNVA